MIRNLLVGQSQNSLVEISIVQGLNNSTHTHEYQIFPMANQFPSMGMIGVNNGDEFAINFKVKFTNRYAMAVYLDGVNVSQKSGIHSLNEISENNREKYSSHRGLFVSNSKISYLNRYSQKNGENRLYTFTTAKNSGINENLISDPSNLNRIEVYFWKEVLEVSDELPNFSSTDDYSPKVGAGKATNKEFTVAHHIENPLFLGKVTFIHQSSEELNHLGSLLLPVKIDDPMDKVPRS